MTKTNKGNRLPTVEPEVLCWQVPELGKLETDPQDLAEYWRALINELPIGIYIAQDGKFRFANSSFCKLSGYSKDELLGMDSLSLVHPEDRHAVRENAVKMLKGKSSSQYEYRIVTKHGEIKWVQEAVVSFQYNGQRAAWGHVRDVTEQKHLEERLRESEEKLRRMFESVADGIAVLDLNGVIVEANEKVAQIHGFSSRVEVLGRKGLELFAKRDRERARLDMAKTLEQGAAKAIEYSLVRADGSEFPAEVSASVLKDSSGSPAGLIVVIRNIVDRKRAEDELIHLSNAVKMSNDSIVIADLDANIVEVNDATLKMYGTEDKGELIGKNAYYLIAPEDREKALATLKQVLRKGFCETQEYNILTKNGGRLLVEMSTAIMKDAEGKPTGLVAVSRDITERRQAEEEKELMSAQLLHAQKMEAIGTLAGGIAHDFNNLIQAIQGYASLAMTEVDQTDPLYKYLKEIDAACSSAAGLTRHLLMFSRKAPTQVVSVNINEIVQDVQRMLKRLIREDITIHTHLQPDVCTIEADPRSIEQVIMNLALNARDAMPEGGTLTFKTENVTLSKKRCRTIPEARPGKYVCLSVVDTGTGIDTEILPHIFEPFFSTKDPGEGTGLGLSVVYGIVKQHRGWINVQSSPGHGATFKVYLPAIPGDVETNCGESILPGETHSNRNRIVLVEDDARVREFLAEALSENGYVVFEAANAREALDMFDSRRGDFDLIFTDIVLPDMTGFQLVEQIRHRKPEVPVLMGSGYMDNRLQELALGEKRFQIVQKPYAVAELLLAVKAAIEADQS